jgi:hypothetical protein
VFEARLFAKLASLCNVTNCAGCLEGCEGVCVDDTVRRITDIITLHMYNIIIKVNGALISLCVCRLIGPKLMTTDI